LVIVERGFDGVTVSEMTVFNYFPTKEDLVFGRMEFFEEQLVAAAQQRAPEESAVAAFGRMVLADIDQLAARTEMIAKAATLIRASLALQAPGAGNHSALHSPACRRVHHRGVDSRQRTDGRPSRIA
jgi:AcrR family transcriptional regulator